jgi:hypothetical protein
MTTENSCNKCAKCGMDMDMEPFCVSEPVLAARTVETGRDYPWGLDVNPARLICKGDHFVQHPGRVHVTT